MMNPERDPHEHMLGSLDLDVVNSQQVGSLEGLEPEIIVLHVPREVNCFLDLLVVLHDYFKDVIGD